MALFNNLLLSVQPTSFLSLSRHEIVPKQPVLVPVPMHGRFTCSVVQLNDGIAPKLSDHKQRRTANYKPSNWDNELQQLLKKEFSGQVFIERSNVLKEQVKVMLDEDLNRVRQLEFIDDLQRLGISYHFEDQIQSILRRVYTENSSNIEQNEKGLYETALEFRLLRQHDFHVPEEVFDSFKCEKGDFKASISEDTKGLLYLYEASFLLTENDSTLELAREFTSKNLKRILKEKSVDQELDTLVRHSLKIPLHWRIQRVEARWFIDVYEQKPDRSPTILELAKLDFHIVQETYQFDLQYATRWWKNTEFTERLIFARDRLVEHFVWSIGITSDPKYGYCRRMMSKITALISTLDDIYDVYGTVEELELLTDAVERWDIKAIDQLPGYMKIFYIEFYKAINEIAYDALKEGDIHIISYLKNAWADLCRAYLQEAKWYSDGYIPTLQEYLDNAWVSISTPVMLVHAYFLVREPIKLEASEYLVKYHNIIRCSSIILRLANDLGTSTDELERGDIFKSIECYMNENGASSEEAREYINLLISNTWKEMNTERLIRETPFSKIFIGIAMDLCRMAHRMYENGDGHGHQDRITSKRISALLFDPICLAKA